MENKGTEYPDWLRIKECNVITTRDCSGEVNGKLVDILNRNDRIMEEYQEERFQQYYMSTVKRGMFKGFHTHPYKRDTLHVVHGKMVLVIYPHEIAREDAEGAVIDLDSLILVEMGEGAHRTVVFPSKYPHGFFGVKDAVIINYRNPAWEPSDTHQYDVRCDPVVKLLRDRFPGKEE